MPIVNYTTTVAAEKTIGEIQKRLADFGAQRIAIDYQDSRPSAVSFSLSHPEWGISLFSLPIDAEAMQRVLVRQLQIRKPSKATSLEQAERVAWRVLKDWIAAQLALVETTMITLPEVMLPYLVLDPSTGRTLRESMGTMKEIG